MNDDMTALVWNIYLLTGPVGNITNITHCMTRLRLTLRELPAPAAQQRLQQLPGVMGLNIQEDELQIILGPGRVTKATAALTALTQRLASPTAAPATSGDDDEPRTDSAAASAAGPATSDDEASDQKPAAPAFGQAEQLHAAIRAKNATPLKLLFRRIASIFIPLIPAFIACGLISGCVNVAMKLDPLLNGSPVLQLASVAGSCVFWGMNLFVGYNASREFGGTPIIGGALGAFISHPALAGITINGYPLTPGRGGVISVLLIAALAAWLEKRLRRIVPDMFSLFVTPLITFAVSAVIAILVLQPLGGLISDFIGYAATTAIGSGGALAGAILGGTFLPMVMLGVHQTLTPIHAELLNRYGVTILLPVLAMAGGGQVGASLAVYLRTRNARLRKTIASALPVGILGVGEPLIYGVTLPLGRPFIGACIGGACGGAVQAAFAVGAATLGISGLPLAAATDQIPIYLAGLAAAYAGGFIATWIIGFQDPD